MSHSLSVRQSYLLVLLVALLSLLAWSGINPYDRTTWMLEIFPIVIALPILMATYRRFPLTNLLYTLIFIHACILMLGGAYTYARVPLGFWLQDWLDLSRNPYDRIGHLAQGMVPVLIAREILIRGDYVRGKKLLLFIPLCIVMAISAWYELIEWSAAIALGQGADEFLGTQGDPWDTQEDMACALLGAILGLILFKPWHDRQLKAMR